MKGRGKKSEVREVRDKRDRKGGKKRDEVL